MLRSLFCVNKMCSRAPLLSSLYNRKPIVKQDIRHAHLIPKNQYDQFDKWPKNFKMSIMATNYELIPIVVCMVFTVSLVCAFLVYTVMNKEGVMWKPSRTERKEISRTMDLRHPTIHKLMVITLSAYDPWPEMQDVLDAMKRAEMHAAQRNALC